MKQQWHRVGPPYVRAVPGTEFTLDCDLVLLAMGFRPGENGMLEQLGVALDRGNVAADADYMSSVRASPPETRAAASRSVVGDAEGRSSRRHQSF